MNSLANVHLVNFPTSAKEQCTATVQNSKTMNYVFTITKKPNHVRVESLLPLISQDVCSLCLFFMF